MTTLSPVEALQREIDRYESMIKQWTRDQMRGPEDRVYEICVLALEVAKADLKLDLHDAIDPPAPAGITEEWLKNEAYFIDVLKAARAKLYEALQR